MKIYFGVFVCIFLLTEEVDAIRIVECRVNTMRDFCGFAHDNTDSFDWTIAQSTSTDGVIPRRDEPNGFHFCACKPENTTEQHPKGILHTPFFPVLTSSTLSLRFQTKIPSTGARDGSTMHLFIIPRRGKRSRIVTIKHTGHGWKEEYRNVTVTQPFRLSFEAILGPSPSSAIYMDDIYLDVVSNTVKLESDQHRTTKTPSTTPKVTSIDKENNDQESGKVTAFPVCFIMAVISTSILALFIIVFVLICFCIVKHNFSILKRSGHQYEVIYAEHTTTQSSIESSLQLSVRRHRGRTTTTTSSKLLQRISCRMSSPRHSNQSSIYAEIDTTHGELGVDGVDDKDHPAVGVFFVRKGSTGTAFESSFFSTVSGSSSEGTLIEEPNSLDIPDKVKEALFLPYLPQHQISYQQCPEIPFRTPSPAYRTPSPTDVDTGWVDNIIYEGSVDCLNDPVRPAIGIQTLRPQPSAKDVDLSDTRTRGSTL